MSVPNTSSSSMSDFNLHDDIPMVDLIRDSVPPRVESTSIPFPKPCGKYDVDVLCKVLPSLIRWRLFVFYAPFFTGEAFEPEAIVTQFRHPSLPIHLPTPYPRPNHTSPNPCSKYAAHCARKKANAILDGFVKEAPQIDFIELNRRFLVEKKSFQCRNRFTGLKSTALLPTLKTLITVSKRLDIPVGQLELALATYVQYVELLQKKLLRSSADPKTAYARLCACHIADDRQWQHLAQVVYQDARDVSTFSIFPRRDRDHKGKGDEMLTFRHAVLRCCSRYFADLEVERKRCGCGRSGRDYTSGHCMRQETGQEYDYNEDDRQSGIAVSCIMSVMCFLVCARLPYSVLGMHIGSSCLCKKEKRIRYRLSRREEASMDGSFELMRQMTREAQRRAEHHARTERSSGSSRSKRPHRTMVLERIDEASEEE